VRPWHLRLGYEDEAGRIAEDAFEQLHLDGGLSLSIGSSRLELSGRAARSEGDDYPEASGGPVLGSGELRSSMTDDGSLGATLALVTNGGYQHAVTATLAARSRDRTSPAIGFAVPASRESTLYRRLRFAWSVRRTRPDGLSYGGGLELEHEQARNDSVLQLPPSFGGDVSGDYDEGRLIGAGFGELLASLGPARVELSARVDLPEGHDVELSPRLGVTVEAGAATQIHGSFGRAFKLPSFFALASPPALGGNPELDSETSIGGDVGATQRLDRANLELDLTFFHSRYRNLVDFDFDRFLHVNRSSVTAFGGELSAAWRPHERIDVTANATFQEVEDDATSERLLHRPRWYGGASFDWRPHLALNLHADLDITASYLDRQIPVPERDRVDGYTLVGLAATWRALARFELTARVDNVTDREYETFIGFPGIGRSFRLGARWRWAR